MIGTTTTDLKNNYMLEILITPIKLDQHQIWDVNLMAFDIDDFNLDGSKTYLENIKILWPISKPETTIELAKQLTNLLYQCDKDIRYPEEIICRALPQKMTGIEKRMFLSRWDLFKGCMISMFATSKITLPC